MRGGLTDMPTLSTLFERFRDGHPADGDDDSDGDLDESSELADTVVSGDELTQDPFDFDTSELGIERQPDIDYQPNALERVHPAKSNEQHDVQERAFVAEVVSVSQAQKRRSRGGRSLVRQMVGVVGGGILGLTLGYFVLLWWRGPDGDLLGISNRIPTMLLPDTFDRGNDRGIPAREFDPQKPDRVDQAAFVGSAPPEKNPEPLESPLEPQDAKPLIARAEVHDGPHYTIDQLNAALEQAENAREDLLAGSLADPEVKQAKGKSYVVLCQAAESLTFVPNEALPMATRQSAERFFKLTLQDSKARDEIGQIALRWVEYPSRPHGGIFFAGQVLSSRKSGAAHELELELPQGQTLTVLTPDEPGSNSNLVGVIGSIVENPTARISGYAGTADRVVWSRMVLPIE